MTNGTHEVWDNKAVTWVPKKSERGHEIIASNNYTTRSSHDGQIIDSIRKNILGANNTDNMTEPSDKKMKTEANAKKLSKEELQTMCTNAEISKYGNISILKGRRHGLQRQR